MPQLGETVTEGTITRWFKQVGERIEPDEPLFEVSTDKVDSEVPAPSAGFVAEILVAEGETVEVGTRLAVISDAAPEEGGVLEVAGSRPPAAPGAPGGPVGTEPAVTEPPSPPAGEAPAPEPAQAAAPAPALAPEPPPAGAPAEPSPAVTSPIVRRLIAEYGLDASRIEGTGEGGRITRNDVEAARMTAAAASAPAPAPAAPAPAPAAPAPAPAAPAAATAATRTPPAPTRPAPMPAGGDVVVPFDNIRRRTAEHMVRSKATSPHVYTSVEVDFERIERVRRAHQDWRATEGFSLTYLPFVVRAFSDVVREYPHVNASIEGDNLVVHRSVHLGIAVDLEHQGLVAPVLRDVDGKRLRLVAREIRDLATRAKSKSLSPDEVVGGTFTITNMGPFGTVITLPIINQPQVGILAVDSVRKQPVVIEGPDGEDLIAVHHVGHLALAWDHRAFDGAYAAEFLSAVRRVLEERDWEPELA